MFTYPISVSGIRSRALQAGLAGPLVILIHGLSSRADRWTRNLDTLAAAGLRVLAIDLPGHGFADKGSGFDYSARGYSLWLRELVDALGEEKVVMVGTSFGGLVAGQFALDWPNRVHTLTAVGAVGLVPMGEARRLRTAGWLPEMNRGAIRTRLLNSFVDKRLVTEDLIEEDFRINTSPGAADAFACLARYYETTIDNDAVVPKLAARDNPFPIQFIWGAQDETVSPEYGVEANRLLSGSRLDLVADAAHLPYMERTEAFNRVLLDFIRDALH